MTNQLLPSNHEPPLVSIIMGSQSDWGRMRESAGVLDEMGIPYEAKIVSAHRTPDRMVAYAKTARERGVKVIIASAGGAAHLPGMVASMTTLPVLGVPGENSPLDGMDSLLSIVQMPGGIPVGTLAIGKPGAKNAALLAVRILSVYDDAITTRLQAYHEALTSSVADEPSDQ